jgi:hypothetical protein
MMQRFLTWLAAASLALAVVGVSAQQPRPERAAQDRAVEYIRGQQAADGSFGPLGQTMDAVLALKAAGVNPAGVTRGGQSAAGFLRAQVRTATSPGAAGKAAIGAVALGIDPRNVAGVNLVKVITDGYDPATGRYAGDEFSQSIAMIALVVAGEPVPAAATQALITAQLEDGGWGFDGFSDADTTAIAVQALVAVNAPRGGWDVRATAYFAANQYADGGWGYFDESNANSTAFVVQALLALRLNPLDAAWRKGSASSISYLLSQQLPDGSFAGYDPAYATNQVVPALAGLTFAESAQGPQAGAPAPDVEATPTPSPVAVPAPPKTGTGTTGDGVSHLPVMGLVLLLGGGSLLLTVRKARG